jgi:hypothetical protein
MTKVALLLKYSIILLVFYSPCHARWATYDDAAIETIFYNRDIQIKADGTGKETIETKIKLLNEAGRNQKSKQTLVYDTASSKIKVLAAKTIYNGIEYPVDLKLVEDKPLASNVNGFDQINQILLAYPHAEVGAELYLKYELLHTKSYPNKFFNTNFVYGAGSYWVTSKVTVTSEQPFFLEINDKEHYLDIKQSNDKKQHTIEINLLRPVYKQIVDEASYAFNPDKFPAVNLSTINNWKVFGNLIAEDYTKKLAQPLPELYTEIANQAKKADKLTDKVNIITSLLNDKIQYMGDWKATDGKFIPQDFAKVATTRLGDCKDYSSATVAILRSLGITTANVALVNRGEGNYQLPFTQPGLDHFNHAIVHIKQADGSDLWIDPTNYTSMAGKIYPDIANKQVLILSAGDTVLARTPEINFITNKMIVTKNINFCSANNCIAEITGSLQLINQEALLYTGSSKYVSLETIKNSILRNVANYEQTMDTEVIMPDLTSRVVQDLEFKFKFKERNLTSITNAGSSIEVKSPYVNAFVVHENTAADLYLGNPNTINFKLNLINIKPNGNKNLDYTLSTPWLNVTRKVIYDKNAVSVEQTIQIKQRLIPNEVLKTDEYKKMQQEIEENLSGGIGVIFDNK